MYDPKRKDYLMDIPYLINHFIYEYDISKANLNVLFHEGIVQQSLYDEIIGYNRGQREIFFGNWERRDPNVSKTLAEGLIKFKTAFIETNGLTEFDILSVKNDAFFIIDKRIDHTKFDNVEFKLKNVYTSYYNINKLELYYYLDTINDLEKLDVKGIKDERLERHQDYFINFLLSIFDAIQTNTVESCIDLVLGFYNKYVRRELDLGYYREFNSDSLYRLTFPNGMQFLTTNVGTESLEYLNIMNNLNIIRELSAIVNSIYSRK